MDKMVEHEANPNSEEAKEYYKNLSALQRQKKNRKPASVIIKNMRGGQTLHTQTIEQNEDGTALSEEELIHKKKFIDFAAVAYPEVNPIDLVVKDLKGNGTVRLQNYRYPANSGSARKGIVQWIHGLNDYSGRYAYLAKILTQNGYDVVAMDQRGFGFSEGARGFIESGESARDDILEFTR